MSTSSNPLLIPISRDHTLPEERISPSYIKHLLGPLRKSSQHNNRQKAQSNMKAKLPDISEIFSSLDEETRIDGFKSETTDSKITPSSFPILTMHLDPPTPLEQIIQEEKEMKKKQSENLAEFEANSAPKQRRNKKPSTFSKQNQPILATHSNLTQEQLFIEPIRKIYRIHYRFSHKFTYRFKEIKLTVTDDVDADQFIKMLLARIGKGPNRFKKVVYIEKERDLVPLTCMDQLYLRHRNFVQVRDEVEQVRVIQKPILLKKRNKPQIGITKLIEGDNFKEFQFIEERSKLSDLNIQSSLDEQEFHS